MARFFTSLGVLGVLVFGCAAAPQTQRRRPKVDVAAMQDAIRSSEASGENYASSASYAHFLKSRLLYQQGDHPQAIDQLRLALVTDDGDPYLLVSLAEEYARIGDLDRAERTLRRAVESSPNYAPAQLLMGRVLAEEKKLSRARFHLHRAIKLAPTEIDAYLALAELELEANRADAAIAVMESMAKSVPDDSRGFRLLGGVFVDKGDLGRAERVLKRAVEVFPGDYEAWARLARLYESSDRHKEAEAAYAEALQRDSENVDLLLSAGRAALAIGADARARAWFDRILSLTDDPETAVRIAFSYVSAGKLNEATEILEHARSRPGTTEPRLAFYAALMHEKLGDYRRAIDAYAAVPSSSELFREARARRANALSLSGQHARALEAFRKLVAERPDDPELYPPYARALERSGAMQQAEKVLRAATQKWQTPDLYEALSQNLERQRRVKDAVALLESALKSHPGEVALRFLLGAIYERAGQTDESLSQMREVLKINPDDPAALNFVGYTLADHGRDFDEAERLVKRALLLKPDSGAFLDSLGWVYFQKGETEKAVQVLEKASALSPEEAEIAEHLGDAYLRAEKREQAAQLYQRALELLKKGDAPVDAKRLRQQLEQKLKFLSSEAAGR